MIQNRALIFLAAVSLLASSGQGARAQDAGQTVVRKQFLDAAEAAHKSGHHNVSLEYLKRAAGIGTSATLYLYMAQEQEELNQILDAYASAQECLHAAEFDPKTRLREQAIAECTALVAKLAPRIAHVIIDFDAPPMGSTLRVNGAATSLQIAGVPLPVNAGPVTIEVNAPGYKPFKAEITVAPAEARHVPVALQSAVCADGAPRASDGRCPPPPAPAPANAALPPQAPGSAAAPAVSPLVGASAAPATTSPAGTLSMRRWSYVAAGGGAALVLGGGIAWAIAGSKYSSTKDACSTGCSPDSRASGVSSIQTWDTLTNVGLIAGGALLAGGAALFFASSPAETGGSTHVSLDVDPTRATLLVGGSF